MYIAHKSVACNHVHETTNKSQTKSKKIQLSKQMINFLIEQFLRRTVPRPTNFFYANTCICQILGEQFITIALSLCQKMRKRIGQTKDVNGCPEKKCRKDSRSRSKHQKREMFKFVFSANFLHLFGKVRKSFCC